MNLLTWILSLIAEWLRPLHRRDPVLAPLAPAGIADPAATAPGARRVGLTDRDPDRHPHQKADPAPHPDPDTPLEQADGPTLGVDRPFDEDGQRDPSDDAFAQDVAREHERGDTEGGDPLPDRPGGPAADAIAGNGLSAINPFWRVGDVLLSRLAPSVSTPIEASTWAAIVVLPAALVLLIQAGLVALGLPGDLLALVLTVLVLYFTVPLGRLWRRLDRLSLLAAAGDVAGFRQVSARWQADGLAIGLNGEATATAIDRSPGAAGHSQARTAAAGGLDRAGFSLPLIDGYRDVFAPMLWFTVIGPAGPIAYGLARLVAERRPGFARRALHWIDWLPSRLAAASFALSGHFDDAMLSFRSALAASRYDRIDVRVDREPGFSLNLVLLPTAAGATGIRLASPAIEARLQQASGDHEFPATEPTVANFSQLRSLIGRTAMLWGGLWVLLALVD